MRRGSPGGYPGDRHAGVNASVKVLVGVYGVYDLIAMWETYRANSPLDNNIENFLGASPMEDRALYFDASPISYATYANNRTAVLLGYGTEDDLVDRKAHSEAFLRALKQAGCFARSVVVQGAGHYWLSDPLDETGSHSGFLRAALDALSRREAVIWSGFRPIGMTVGWAKGARLARRAHAVSPTVGTRGLVRALPTLRVR